MKKNIRARNSQGFTLIEILMAIAIMAILAAVAWPAYEHYLTKNRRIDGVRALMSNASRMEKCFINSGDYTTCTINTPSDKGYYAISVNTTTETYTLTATPQNQQSGDSECAKLTLDHLGQKGITGSASVKRCWSQ